MTIYDLDAVLEYDDEYLILDYEHLFISATLREEALLLQQRKDDDLIRKVMADAAAFDFLEVDADRNVDQYSGGQRAILACLLMLAFIDTQNNQGLKLLLNHVLESISSANRKRLFKRFDKFKDSHGIRVFSKDQGEIREWN